jgi:hypothetical protein
MHERVSHGVNVLWTCPGLVDPLVVIDVFRSLVVNAACSATSAFLPRRKPGDLTAVNAVRNRQ